MRYKPHLDGLFVPDARGVLLLTRAHLARARDLTDWDVEPVAGDGYLVQAKDLAAWFAQPDPDPQVLSKARADLGDMILTTAAIAANPPPWRRVHR